MVGVVRRAILNGASHSVISNQMPKRKPTAEQIQTGMRALLDAQAKKALHLAENTAQESGDGSLHSVQRDHGPKHS